MRKIILNTFIFSILLSNNSFAKKGVTAIIIDRNEKFKAIERVVVLKDLESDDSYDGQYFKIVLGKSEEAIKFTESRELNLKAATVYYHLMKARKFFLSGLNSEFVKNAKKMTIRLELTHKFSELGHYANDNLEPQYNNALSINAGAGLPGKNISPWGNEIWFRPSKKINVKEILKFQGGVVPYKTLLRQFRNQMHMTNLNKFMLSLLTKQYQGWGPEAINSVFRLAGTSVILEAGYQGFDSLSKVFSRKWYYLDTALVPEIIYHEYAHIALSDGLKITHSTPINEGMADFFAGIIADSPKLALKIKKYNTFSGKNARRKDLYRLEFEQNDFANADFVFGLLWEVRHIVGKDKANNLVYALRNKLDSDSSVRVSLLNAILDQCKIDCKNYKVERLKLYDLFSSQGF